MNRITVLSLNVLRLGMFAGIALFASGRLRADTNSPDAALGRQVEQLFAGRDANAFAQALAANPKDWQEARTNAVSEKADAIPDTAREQTANYERKAIAASARNLIEQSARLGIDPVQVRLVFQEVRTNQRAGMMDRNGVKLPWYNDLKIVLRGEPVADAGKRFAGEYEVVLGGVYRFPAGWRCYQGIRWSKFPDGVADEQTRAELAIVERVEARSHSLETTDDSALGKLGEALIPFFQKGDLQAFTNGALRSGDEMWNEFQAQTKGRGMTNGPSRKAFDENYGVWMGQIGDSARRALDQLAAAGIDFTGAKITLKSAAAENVFQREAYGSVAGMSANALRFKYSVESERKAKSGKTIAGDYVLSAKRGSRTATRWTIEDRIRWETFPEGLLGEKEQAGQKFENYIAQHGSLPPGMAAPEIEFVRLDTEAKEKLSAYRGKVVILDFWATWCGPCQEPMAHLQTLAGDNPGWKDRVQIISLSIDNTTAEIRKHLAKKGWTNTFNTWAGQGAWTSTPAKQFRVTGVPTMYVIDAEGKIAQAGHPAGLERGLTNLVNSLLKK